MAGQERYKGWTGVQFPFHFDGRRRVASSTTGIGNPQHIVESVRQILGTNFFERVMRPEFGANLIGTVFKSKNRTGIEEIIAVIPDALKRWEPRVRVNSVQVVKNTDELIAVKIDLEIIALRQSIEEVYLIPREVFGL